MIFIMNHHDFTLFLWSKITQHWATKFTADEPEQLCESNARLIDPPLCYRKWQQCCCPVILALCWFSHPILILPEPANSIPYKSTQAAWNLNKDSIHARLKNSRFRFSLECIPVNHLKVNSTSILDNSGAHHSDSTHDVGWFWERQKDMHSGATL